MLNADSSKQFLMISFFVENSLVNGEDIIGNFWIGE